MGYDYRVVRKDDHSVILFETDYISTLRARVVHELPASLEDFDVYVNEENHYVDLSIFLRATGDPAYLIVNVFYPDEGPLFETNKIEDVIKWRDEHIADAREVSVIRSIVGDRIDLNHFLEVVLGETKKEAVEKTTESEYLIIDSFDPSAPILLETDEISEILEWRSKNIAASKASSVYRVGIGDRIDLTSFLEETVGFDEEEDSDAVNHPSHYNQYKGIEIIQLVRQMNFNRGNAVKYVARAKFKDPEKEVEDLKKAIWYLRDEIKRITEEQA
jgi:hypothetical protein